MPVSITMPALSPTMTEGTLSKWVKKEGDTVEAGDVIAEIETDKATMEVEAVDEGTLGKILISEGTEGVEVNKMIAVLLEEGEDESDLEAFLKEGASGQDNKKKESKTDSPSSKSDKQSEAKDRKGEDTSEAEAVGSGYGAGSGFTDTPAAQAKSSSSSSKGRVFASPLAKRLAKDYGLDIAAINGSGPHGRIIKSDVEKAKSSGIGVTSPKAAATGSLPAPQGPDARQLADMLDMPYEAIANNKMRKTIASRLLESKVTVPHFYLTIECRIDSLLDVRKQLNDEANGAYKLSVNDLVIKACALALKKVPAANSAWTDSHILRFEHADISVAVATDDGLITPIIHQADSKSLQDISEKMKDLATRAREGKLKPTEYQGGTFSISNLGMYGIKEFSAIINPPQGCILAVGAGGKKPVVDDNGQLSVGTMMSCTLSCDHRVVDGAVGAQFLQAFQDIIEHPVKMFV